MNLLEDKPSHTRLFPSKETLFSLKMLCKDMDIVFSGFIIFFQTLYFTLNVNIETGSACVMAWILYLQILEKR